MDSTQQTSFIPKKSFAPVPSAYQKKSVGLLTLIALVIFITSIAGAIGVYLYQGLLTNSLAAKKVSLERARGAFDPALIEELKRLNRRIEVSKVLLKNHVALSSLFDVLQSATSKNIRYDSFDWNGLSDNNTMALIMHGQAKSYASVAFQSSVFAKTAAIKEPVFSDLTLDQRGSIVFTLSATIDPTALRYNPTPDSGTPADQGTTPTTQ